MSIENIEINNLDCDNYKQYPNMYIEFSSKLGDDYPYLLRKIRAQKKRMEEKDKSIKFLSSIERDVETKYTSDVNGYALNRNGYIFDIWKIFKPCASKYSSLSR